MLPVMAAEAEANTLPKAAAACTHSAVLSAPSPAPLDELPEPLLEALAVVEVVCWPEPADSDAFFELEQAEAIEATSRPATSRPLTRLSCMVPSPSWPAGRPHHRPKP